MKKTRKILYCLGKSLKLFKVLALYVLMLIFSLPAVMAGSGDQEIVLSVDYKNVSLKDVLLDLQSRTSMNYLYKKEDISDYKSINFSTQNASLEKILDGILVGTKLKYKINKGVVILSPKKVKNESNQEDKDKREISGKVVDEKGNPMPGVAVVVQGTHLGTATDSRGRFKIKVTSKDALTFTFIGYKDQIILVKDKEKIEVQMKPEVEKLDEVSVVAFGEQKKESVVSSISTVKPESLKSSNSDLTSQLTGKIAGVMGMQLGGKPGALTEEEMNTKFYIRGITSYQTGANVDPLILLDGIEISKLDLARIDPDDIESFNVMKDASATAMYGARGANGVIYVKTKKGKEGDLYASFRYERIMSKSTKELDVVNPIDYMKYYNRAIVGRGLSDIPYYSNERIKNTASEKFPSWVYPANDWFNTLFKDYSINNHYALNLRGGGAKVQYYISITHNDDNGMLKTDKLNDFDCNINNKQTGFRFNINANLNSTAKLSLNSFTTYDKYHGSLADVTQAYGMAFNANPVEFAPVYPADENYNWPHIRFGGSRSSYNPYAEIQKGYQDRIRFSTVNVAEYIQNLGKYIKGLELRASVGISQASYFANRYSTRPALYTLLNYDHVTGKHKLLEMQKGNESIEKELQTPIQSKTIADYQLRLLHSAAWGDHQTSFTAVGTAREIIDSAPADILTSLPYRNISIATRMSYGYKDKYFIEGSLGINGSERFAKGERIGYFPAIGAAWVLTKEDFLRSTSSWLNFAKLRISYGQTGNDGVIRNPRFLYLEDVNHTGNVFYGEPRTGKPMYEVYNYARKNTKWEIAEMANLGFEFKLFNDLIEFNGDIYQEIRHNIYDYRYYLPETLGNIELPLDNIGKVKSRGFDISAKIQHAFSNDFWFLISGTYTYNKSTFKKLEEPINKKDWQKKVGHDISQQYCYIADGLFQDWEEINNSPYQAGDVQPGDIKYRDVDGNGLIDINDVVMVGYPENPRSIYGLSAFVHYKGLEFSMAFQGSGQRTFFINPQKISPFENNRAMLKKIADDHWTPENQKLKPFWPKLSVNNIIEHNPQEEYYKKDASEVRKSTYFMHEAKFLRCTNLELGYYVNKELAKKIGLRNLRLYLRTNNPFIISDFDLWDVELGENGFNYPIQKTYSVGLTLSF